MVAATTRSRSSCATPRRCRRAFGSLPVTSNKPVRCRPGRCDHRPEQRGHRLRWRSRCRRQARARLSAKSTGPLRTRSPLAPLPGHRLPREGCSPLRTSHQRRFIAHLAPSHPIHVLTTEITLGGEEIVCPAPQLQVLLRRRTAEGVRFAMMYLESPGFRTTNPSRVDERASRDVTGPNRASDGSRDMTSVTRV